MRGESAVIVWSVKVKKKPLLWTVGILVAVLTVVIVLATRWAGTSAVSGRPSAMAETDEQRRAFLASCGRELAADPVEIRQVIIPEVFNEVYTQYNAMQKEQGFDLTRYRGKTARRWTDEVTNYPGTESRIYADLLIYDGRIIGGSIGTREADGFMHGFRRPETAAESGA